MPSYVFIYEVQTTVPGHEAGNFLSVLNKLYPDTLTNGGVGLLGLQTTTTKKSVGV